MINPDILVEEYSRIIDCGRCIRQGCNRILRDENNLPQPGFIGKNYSKRGIIFIPQNPGYAKPDRTLQHQRYAEAEETFVKERTVEAMDNLLTLLEKVMPYWTIYDKEVFPLLARCNLTLADIAYFNGVRCPTKGNIKPSDIMLTNCTVHLKNWLNCLEPKVVVCIGKWIYQEISPILTSYHIPHTFVNRDRSLSLSEKVQNFGDISQFVRSAFQSSGTFKQAADVGRKTVSTVKTGTSKYKIIDHGQEAHEMSTQYKIGQIVIYRGKTGRVVEALKNDKGYGVVRDEMKRRCGRGQWVGNLGTGGKGEAGDGGEMYRLEKV